MLIHNLLRFVPRPWGTSLHTLAHAQGAHSAAPTRMQGYTPYQSYGTLALIPCYTGLGSTQPQKLVVEVRVS